MAVVTVWWFASPDGAEDALHLLHDRQVPMWDAAVVSWPEDRALPEVRRPGRVVGDAVLGGAFWGLVSGLPLSSPVLGAAVGAGVGLLVACLTRPGLADDTVVGCRRHVTRGSSVLALLSDGADVLDVLSAAGARYP
ncbi:putative membrane protein [Saccharothrix tamanrassetensis]|uniref:Putative membrane protein n=1 Tax=Saccharothrix tamanrassetensis TaxID=1051531 RepID=A0A841CSU7_9PSEU|nr:DUF1269 domain-containing protein [Saccharothrix tamanrassetensis]MBB5958506.1 putative membrane protein [Saccharothrix tamanrassetensis]